MKKIFVPLLALALGFSACETEVDVNADYKDITNVFALLDPNDPVHYVKITKAFLGEGNAFTMALEPDSLYYDEARMRAKLLQLDVNNNVVKTIDLVRVDTVPKEEGTFANPNQIIYVTNEPLTVKGVYELEVEKILEGEFVKGTAGIVSNPNVTRPLQSSKINPAGTSNSIKFGIDGRTQTYRIGIELTYAEEDTVRNITVEKKLEYKLPTQSVTIGSSHNEEAIYTGIGFMTYIAGSLGAPAENIIRHARSLSYKFYLTSADFNTYIDLNGPSDGIVQERPEFTNIENGIGLFASRNISYGLENLELFPAFYDSLVCAKTMQGIGFAKYVTNAGINGTDTILNCDL